MVLSVTVLQRVLNAEPATLAITLAVGLAAICAPILASIYLAWRQSLAAEKSLSLIYAHDVLRRVEETANQFAAAKRRISDAKFPPCSPDDIDLLRQIDLGSSYIHAAGRTVRRHSALHIARVTAPVPLGKPSLISSRGVSEYFSVSCRRSSGALSTSLQPAASPSSSTPIWPRTLPPKEV